MSEDVEAMLSRARLELLEKKREIRDTVRENYKELVGVSNHASKASKLCDSVFATYERMLNLSKNLRLKAATIQLAASSSPTAREATKVAPTENSDELTIIHESLSLNWRIMSHAKKFDFLAISKMLDQLDTDPTESSRFSHLSQSFQNPMDVVRSRIESYCIHALGSVLMNSRQRCFDCVSLLKKVSSGVDIASIFWSRRTSLLDSIIRTNAPCIQAVIHYDLSCGIAMEYGFGVPVDVYARYGKADGAIGIAMFEELHRVSSLGLLSQIYKSMREQFTQSRTYDSVDLSVDLIDPIVQQVTELLVRSVMANQLDLGIHDSDWNLQSLNSTIEQVIHDCETDLRHLFSENDIVRVIGQELGKQLVAACVSVRQVTASNPRIKAVNMSKILSAFSGQTGTRNITESTTISFKRSIVPLIGIDFVPSSPGLERVGDCIETLPKLESFVGEEFSRYWEIVVKENKPTTYRKITGYTVLNSSEIALPMYPSQPVADLVVPICVALVELPVHAWPHAVKSAKNFILENVPTLEKTVQGLFDLNWILTLTSSMEDGNRYTELSERVYEEVEQVALSDPLDRAIYKDLIKRAGYVACVRQRVLLGPLIHSGNPRYLHGFSNVNSDEIKIRQERIEPLDSTVERFPTLPLAKTVIPAAQPAAVKRPPANDSRRSSVQTAGVSLNAATSSVTSFFNSVGSKMSLK